MARSEPLTAQMVLSKTKADSIQAVKNLNLWGNDIEDLQLLKQMPFLQVISLSVNKIATLKQFANCLKLQELYLRKNLIQDIQEVRYLSKLPELKVLWLQDNPCSQIDNYRLVVIRLLPNLNKLDNNIVTPEERELSKHVRIPGMDSSTIEKKESRSQSLIAKNLAQAEPEGRVFERSNQGLLSALFILFKELSREGLTFASSQLDRMIAQKR